jgi:hypothetical protein
VGKKRSWKWKYAETKAKHTIALLEHHYELGQRAKEMSTDQIRKLAAHVGYAPMSIRRMKQLAKRLKEPNFDELCGRGGTDRLLHWGHFFQLAALENSSQIARFAEKARKNHWTPRQLHAAIRKTLPPKRRRASHRQPRIHENLGLNLQQLAAEARSWVKRCRKFLEWRNGKKIGPKIAKPLRASLDELLAAAGSLRQLFDSDK